MPTRPRGCSPKETTGNRSKRVTVQGKPRKTHQCKLGANVGFHRRGSFVIFPHLSCLVAHSSTTT